jgi:hypothetical protein
MTLKQSVGIFRVLRCDQPGCDWLFDGQPGDLVATVRGRARAHGWLCDNPGPRKPARDLCPQHRPGRKT